ncbi:MAG: DUF4831 family protein, partial [Tannerella sp.]|jgi:hypothetical protein|nr:DUF4831 family protein [Tannerella sp.]
LPRTSFIINAEVTKISIKAGPYYRWAEQYLGVKDVPAEDRVYYQLGDITLTNKGIPDENNRYKIEFKQKTVAPFVYLTDDGLLCAINAEFTPETAPSSRKRPDNNAANAASTIPALTEELLMAGSVAKQAEVAAKQIYRLRESKTDILTGDADNMPPDGEAMKLIISKLEEQEKALTKLFTGTETQETSSFEISILPDDELEHEVLFRFSSKLGILDDDDLAGEPVYMNLTALERAPVLDAKEAAKKEKEMKGVIYNVPGKALVEIVRANKTVLKREEPFVQFGTQESLMPVILEDKREIVKVIFYPETGGIRQITK